MPLRNFLVVLFCMMLVPGLILAVQPIEVEQSTNSLSVIQATASLALDLPSTPSPTPGPKVAPAAYFYLARRIPTGVAGIANPTGLAYFAPEQALLVTDNRLALNWQQQSTFAQIDLLTEEMTGLLQMDSPVADPINFTYDGKTNAFLSIDAAGQRLDHRKPGLGRWQADRGMDTGGLNLAQPEGIAADPESGVLYFLDAAQRAIKALHPDGTVTIIRVPGKIKKDLRGIGYNPFNHHLYLLSPSGPEVYELSSSGDLIGMMDLAGQGITDPQALVFAPSGNPTDDPAVQSLYMVDGGQEAGPSAAKEGAIIELLVYEPAQMQAAFTRSVTLIQTIQLRQPYWPYDAPDPAGLTYWPSKNALLVSDSEVEKHELFQGRNLFFSTVGGQMLDAYTTQPTSDEPTDVTVNTVNGHLFVSDDDRARVFEFNPGNDGKLNTADDVITYFKTSEFGCLDPEGVAYGEGMLFVLDGKGNEIYVIDPGLDGKFNGVTSGDDVLVRNIDTQVMGMADPEGIDYTPLTGTLFIAGPSAHRKLIEVSIIGELVSTADISVADPGAPAGVAVAPSSNQPGHWSIFISDRGVDPGSDPHENDGLIYELALSDMPVATVTPSVSPTITHTPTDTQPATRTFTATSTRTPTRTPRPTRTPTPTATITPTFTATSTPTCAPNSFPGTPKPNGDYCWFSNFAPFIINQMDRP